METLHRDVLSDQQKRLYDTMIQAGFDQDNAYNCISDAQTMKLYGRFQYENVPDLKKGEITKELYRRRFFSLLKRRGLKI